jgi:hypothetical protein
MNFNQAMSSFEEKYDRQDAKQRQGSPRKERERNSA